MTAFNDLLKAHSKHATARTSRQHVRLINHVDELYYDFEYHRAECRSMGRSRRVLLRLIRQSIKAGTLDLDTWRVDRKGFMVDNWCEHKIRSQPGFRPAQAKGSRMTWRSDHDQASK